MSIFTSDPPRALSLAIDLDGTLAHWASADVFVGAWIDGAQAALLAFRKADYKVVVQTCRATWAEGGGLKAVADFLRTGGFVPFAVSGVETDGWSQEVWRYVYPDGTVKQHDEVAPYLQDDRAVGVWVGLGKPVAHAYIDDRAVPFRPDEGVGWTELVAMLLR